MRRPYGGRWQFNGPLVSLGPIKRHRGESSQPLIQRPYGIDLDINREPRSSDGVTASDNVE